MPPDQTGDNVVDNFIGVGKSEGRLFLPENYRAGIRSDIHFIDGVWMVTIFNNGSTENRSFRDESEARGYASKRIQHLSANNGSPQK